MTGRDAARDALVADLRAALENAVDDEGWLLDAADLLLSRGYRRSITPTERPERVDPNYIRWCEWPSCLRSYSALNGPNPAIDGTPWIQVRGALLCPDHQGLGHRPGKFEWDLGSPTIAMSCECGERADDLKPATHDRCQTWWREHVARAFGLEVASE